MCFSQDVPSAPAPPPPPPPPTDTGTLSIKSSASRTSSKRKKSQKTGRNEFRSDLSVNTGSSTGSGLNL